MKTHRDSKGAGNLAGETGSGRYREIEHTADWELEVWAADLPGLLETAARGMYKLSGVQIGLNANASRQIELEVSDRESLLVGFLNQLVYLSETEKIAFQDFDFNVQGENLSVRLSGGPIVAVDKAIKAVTFHNLVVQETEEGLYTRIVFDV